MNLITVFTRYPDQEACIEFLEKVRWNGEAHCPHCGSKKVARKCDGDRVGRWNCHDCKSSFNVLSGTVFSKTKVPLQKWFVAIALVVNAKKSMSSYQLGRDLDLNQKTAHYMQQRIRAEMATKQAKMLFGIVEADETYIGGKPRKFNSHKTEQTNSRGRGTRKTAIIGATERGGKVNAKVASDLTVKGILNFLKDTVDIDNTLLMTDEYRAYNALDKILPRSVINRTVRYVDGMTHTNTIEGFWSLLKRAWYGSHHHYDKKYTPLYLTEACWRYNIRTNENAFSSFFRGCFK